MNQKKTTTEKARERALLWRFLRGSKGWFLISMVSAAIAALCDMVTPQIVRAAVDNALGGKEANLPGFAMRLVDRAGGFRYLGEHIWIMALALLAVALLKGRQGILISLMDWFMRGRLSINIKELFQ